MEQVVYLNKERYDGILVGQDEFLTSLDFCFTLILEIGLVI
jgi:hypothetical protein